MRPVLLYKLALTGKETAKVFEIAQCASPAVGRILSVEASRDDAFPDLWNVQIFHREFHTHLRITDFETGRIREVAPLPMIDLTWFETHYKVEKENPLS